MKRLALFVLAVSLCASAQYLPMGSVSPVSGGTPTASTPTFSPVAGTYSGTQSVTISSSTAGATLCYTTDGSDPAASTPGTCSAGSTYSTPVSVASSLTLKALATKAAYINSVVASAGYTINAGGPPSDDFSGAAGALSANWTNLLAHAITLNGSGYAHGNDVWQSAEARWTGSAVSNNQYAEIVIGAIDPGKVDYPGVMVRVQADGSGYVAFTGGSAYVQLGRVSGSGSPALLKNGSECGAVALTTGDTLRLSVTGTVLTVSKNGSVLSGCTYDTASDGTKYASGAPGIRIERGSNGSDPTINSFAAGNN